ncbi:MAG: hypothetical protein ACYC8T_33740, partial [Myxococcaceae bacterium]
KTYNMTVKGDVAIRSGVAAAAAPVATSKPREARMRVLERKQGQARVRDDLGNEGWVKESDLAAW